MFASVYLNLLARGYKIKTCAYERNTRVFWHKCQAHVGCHRQADAFWAGILHLGFTPHTALSRTRRGSFPSACATLSLPTAMPLCQCRLACLMDIRPLEISLSKRADAVSGSASAAFQLPAFSEFVRQVCVLFERPQHATGQFGQGSCGHTFGEQGPAPQGSNLSRASCQRPLPPGCDRCKGRRPLGVRGRLFSPPPCACQRPSRAGGPSPCPSKRLCPPMVWLVVRCSFARLR